MASAIEPRQPLTEEAALAKFKAAREQPTEEVKNEEVQASEGQGQEQEALLETTEVTQEPAEKSADNVSEPAQEARGDAETVELDVEQLSDILGIEPDFLDVDDSGKISLKTKVDGEEGKTTLKDLLKSHQIDAHLTKKGQEIQKLEEQRKRELSEFVSKTQSFAQQSAQVLEVLKETFIQPLSEADLKALRESDPAEYAARKEEQRDRELKFSQIAGKALQEIEQAQKAQAEEMQRQYSAYLQEQSQMLQKNIPNIKDEAKNISAYAQNLGFSESEINQIADARIFTALYKAMQFDKGSTAAKTKLVKPMPKVIKPGARVNRNQLALEDLAKKKATLKKSGNPDDLLALLRATRN
jgi:hypothetical protein